MSLSYSECLKVSAYNFLADSKHKLTLMYLANDVIQMSKKKGPEFKLEFLKVLPRCFQMVSRDPDGSLLKSVERIVNVWEERKVLDGEVIIRLKSLLGKTMARRD